MSLMRGLLAVLAVIALLAGCARAPETPPGPVDPEVLANRVIDPAYLPDALPYEIDPKQVFYTTVSLWHDREIHSTTNYDRGVHIPVNSKVWIYPLLIGTRGQKVADLRIKVLSSGEFVRFAFSRYAEASKNEIVYRTFSLEPVDLSRLDEPLQAKIMAGELEAGMTRYQALLARGYPPAHRTPDLHADTWEYWSARYRSSEIHFVEGRLEQP